MSEARVYTVCVQAHYDAAHFLRNYEGKCQRLHGHRYVVEAALQTAELNETGISFDFVDLKRELRDLAERLDHENLNDLPWFEGLETSVENQARWFFDELSGRLPAELAGGLLYVRIWETPTQWVQYGPAHAPVPAHRAAGMQEGG